MIDFVRVGNNISKYRKLLNLSQDQLAERLYVTRQALSKWENGVSIPSIDTLLALSKIFQVSFEEILSLNENSDLIVDESNIFSGHERNYVIQKIIKGNIKVSLEDVFYQFSPSERLTMLKAIKEQRFNCNLFELWVKLTPSEQKFLGGNLYEIQKSHY